MNKQICDMCKEETMYVGYKLYSTYDVMDELELCPKCGELLVEFITNHVKRVELIKE